MNLKFCMNSTKNRNQSKMAPPRTYFDLTIQWVVSSWSSTRLFPVLLRTSALCARATRDSATRSASSILTLCQGGDVTNHNGTDGKSIYGNKHRTRNLVHVKTSKV